MSTLLGKDAVIVIDCDHLTDGKPSLEGYRIKEGLTRLPLRVMLIHDGKEYSVVTIRFNEELHVVCEIVKESVERSLQELGV